MTLDIYTKDEVADLINQAKKDFESYVKREIKQAQIDALPNLLKTHEMARLLNINDNTLRMKKAKFAQGKHFYKKNGRILWDKNAVLESVNDEILR